MAHHRFNGSITLEPFSAARLAYNGYCLSSGSNKFLAATFLRFEFPHKACRPTRKA